MRIHLRFEPTEDTVHATMRVFVNGASAGLLTMRKDEATDLQRILICGSDSNDKIEMSVKMVAAS